MTTPSLIRSYDELIKTSDSTPVIKNMYEELYTAYTREVEARLHLQKEYDEMQIMVRHQQKMFAMVKKLYGEQVVAATLDAVTGLPNHRAVMARTDEEIRACQQSQRSCAILFVDLDHFKRVNDTWGHRAGDEVLREVGQRLRTNVREDDFVGRYGGEEFALVLLDTDFVQATLVAERLREGIASKPCTWENDTTQKIIPISVTISIGVAVYPVDGVTREVLIEAADCAMYQAKRTGRNRVCVAETVHAQETVSCAQSAYQEREREGMEVR